MFTTGKQHDWVRSIAAAATLLFSLTFVALPAPSLAQDGAKPLALVPGRSDGAVQPDGGRYALIVAVRDYPASLNAQRVSDLQYTVKGAQALKDVLITHGGFPAANVTELYDGEATVRNVYNYLDQLNDSQRFPHVETLLVYFSGHGCIIDSVNPRLAAGGSSGHYFLNYDGSVLPDSAEKLDINLDDVVAKLDQIRANRGFKRVVMFIDACQVYQQTWDDAKGAMGMSIAGPSSVSVDFGLLNPDASGLAGLKSSKRATPSWEDSGELRMGVFTYFLLRALQGKDNAADANGLVTFDAVVNTVSRDLYSWTRDHPDEAQEPERFGNAAGAIPLTIVRLDKAQTPRAQAERYRAEGLDAERAGRFNDALVDYRLAQTADPAWAWPPYDIAGTLYLLGQYDEALRSLELASSLDPAWPLPYCNEGLVYYRMGRNDKAAEFLLRAVKLDPNWAFPLLKLGNVYSTTGQDSKAVDAYQRVLVLAPKWALAHNNLGIKYFQAKRFEAAQTEFAKAAELDPMLPLSYMNQGTLFFEQKWYAEAAASFQKAIKVHDFNPAVRSNLSSVSGDDERYEIWRQGKGPDELFASPHYGLGLSYYAMKRYRDALLEFSLASGLDPQWGAPYIASGNAHYLLLEYGDAIKAYKEALQINPADQSASAGLRLAQDAMERAGRGSAP